MKNLVLFSALLFSLIGSAQIPVTDAAAGTSLSIMNTQITLGNTTLNEMLAIQTAAKGEAVQTSANTLNTLSEAQKMNEMFQKINSAISNAKIVADIWDKSKAIIQMTFDMQRVISKSKLSKDVAATMINKATDLLNQMQPIIEIANNIISSGTFKGNDTERLTILMDVKKQLDTQLENLQALSFYSITLNGLSYDLLDIVD